MASRNLRSRSRVKKLDHSHTDYSTSGGFLRVLPEAEDADRSCVKKKLDHSHTDYSTSGGFLRVPPEAQDADRSCVKKKLDHSHTDYSTSGGFLRVPPEAQDADRSCVKKKLDHSHTDYSTSGGFLRVPPEAQDADRSCVKKKLDHSHTDYSTSGGFLRVPPEAQDADRSCVKKKLDHSHTDYSTSGGFLRVPPEAQDADRSCVKKKLDHSHTDYSTSGGFLRVPPEAEYSDRDNTSASSHDQSSEDEWIAKDEDAASDSEYCSTDASEAESSVLVTEQHIYQLSGANIKKTQGSTKETETGGRKKRKRFTCLIKGCAGEVVNLRRHFENVHTDVPKFEVEQLIATSKQQPKRSYPRKMCPFQGCAWVGTRPDKHMSTKHGVSRRESLELARGCKKVESSQLDSKTQNTAQSLSDEFAAWFQSLEGGYYIPEDTPTDKRSQKESQNKKIKYMVQQILEECFGHERFPLRALSLLKLIGRDTDNGNKKSVILRIKEGRSGEGSALTWGTVKNYLSAFSHFLDFLEACYGDHNLDIRGFRTVLKGIVRTVNKHVADESQRRKLKGRENVIPADLISKYFECKMANTLLKGMSQKEGKVGQSDVERIRNHLLLQTALSSGKRIGALADMKCRQFFSAEKVNDEYVVLVEDGKTFRTSGAAGIHFSARDFKDLSFYITKLRPNTNTEQVFCHVEGQHASPSDLNQFLQTAFNDFGMVYHLVVPHITCTLIRKTLVSIARQGDVSRDEMLAMATHMDHTLDTADRIYDTSTGVKCTTRFSKILERFIKFEKDTGDDEAEGGEEGEEHFDAQSAGSDIEQSQTMLQEEPEQASQPSTSTGPLRFGRPEVFPPEDRDRILRCCMPLIEKRLSDGQPLRREDTLEQIKKGGLQFQDLFIRYTQKQLYHRVRLELRKRVDQRKAKKYRK